MNTWLKLTGAVVVSELAGGLGAIFTTPKIPTFYQALIKPEWNPPAAIFGPVWTTLYALMGVSLWLVWQAKNGPAKALALRLFWTQLMVNILWSIVFFGLEQLGAAVAVIFVLLALVLAYIVVVWPMNRRAAIIMLPYAAWVTFAAALNASIWLLNR